MDQSELLHRIEDVEKHRSWSDGITIVAAVAVGIVGFLQMTSWSRSHQIVLNQLLVVMQEVEDVQKRLEDAERQLNAIEKAAKP